jgi:hypothetical protein
MKDFKLYNMKLENTEIKSAIIAVSGSGGRKGESWAIFSQTGVYIARTPLIYE